MDPLLLAGAAVAAILIFSGGKKKSAAPPPGDQDLPPDLPPPPTPSPSRPSGHPPPYLKACYPPAYGGSNRYDTAYWEAGGTARARQRIFEHFGGLGYSTPNDRDTMNDLGPDGKLGEDDVPNEEVRRFQKDYNAVSKKRNVAANMGGLDTDGMVGPCSLNALKYIYDLGANAEWRALVDEARS